MGNTCKPMAVSFQCMTKSTTHTKKIPWTEEPGGLWSMESQRVRLSVHVHTHVHTEVRGLRSLGYHPFSLTSRKKSKGRVDL